MSNWETETVPVTGARQNVVLVCSGSWWESKAYIERCLAYGGVPPARSYIAKNDMDPRLYARLYGRP